MYDKEQYSDITQKKGPQQTREQKLMPLMQMVGGASVVMQTLMTESGAWNRYLEILQGLVNTLKELKATAENQLHGPDIWEASKLAMLKSDVRVFDANIQMLETVMRLPKELITGGSEADIIIKEIEEKYGKSTDTKTS